LESRQPDIQSCEYYCCCPPADNKRIETSKKEFKSHIQLNKSIIKFGLPLFFRDTVSKESSSNKEFVDVLNEGLRTPKDKQIIHTKLFDIRREPNDRRDESSRHFALKRSYLDSGNALQFSTRKDVVNKTIFRYLRKFYTKDFKKYFDFTKVNSFEEDTFMEKLV
jgi:hypothetical protein